MELGDLPVVPVFFIRPGALFRREDDDQAALVQLDEHGLES